MKFINTILAFLYITTASSYSIPNRNVKRNRINYIMDNFKINPERAFQGLKLQTNIDIADVAQCATVIKEYNDCFQSLSVENYDQTCDIYNSEKCQTILNTKIDKNGPCKMSANDLQRELDINIATMDLSCAKDEKNNYCPISNFARNQTETELSYDYIYNTCKSDICKEKAIKSIKFFKEEVYTSNLNKRKEVDMERLITSLDILNNEECKSISVEARKLEITNSLLFSIILLTVFL